MTNEPDWTDLMKRRAKKFVDLLEMDVPEHLLAGAFTLLEAAVAKCVPAEILAYERFRWKSLPTSCELPDSDRIKGEG